MTVDEMRKQKKERGLTNVMIAEMAQLPLGTVQKIFSGETKHPRFDTLNALEAVFETLDFKILKEDTSLPWYEKAAESKEKKPTYYSYQPICTQLVMEPSLNYGTSVLSFPGPFTVDDWFALPEGERAELIDGYLFYLNTPSLLHQLIVGEIYRQIANFIRENKGSCIPAFAPLGVQLDCDDKTMVEPDVMIVCDPEKNHRRNIYGAPDFVLEVLSPSTAKKDIFTKAVKYRFAKVREYWILDPDRAFLDVRSTDSRIPEKGYDLTSPVPLGIYEGKLEIDFSQILDWIRLYKEQ